MPNDVPISSLQPFEPLQDGERIKAEISLVWPYSSSNASAALLLVDPDFRRRHERGQIRVRFQGFAAKAIARAHLGIGDVLQVDLGGARWREKDERALALTPGKAVEAELVFDRKLKIVLLQDASGAVDGKTIDLADPTPVPSSQKRRQADPVTPGPRGRGAGMLGLGTPIAGGYASPAFMKRLRLSQEHFLESPELAGDEENLDSSSARKRRRVSYKNVTEWRFAGGSPTRDTRPPSDEDEPEDVMMGQPRVSTGHTDAATPISSSNVVHSQISVPSSTAPPPTVGNAVKPIDIASSDESGADLEEEDDDDDEEEDEADIVSSAKDAQQDRPANTSGLPAPMAPPPLPRLEMPRSPPKATVEAGAEPKTPELRPSSAAALPLPSPFPQTPLAQFTTTLEAQGSAATLANGSVAQIPAGEKNDYFDSNIIVAGINQDDGVIAEAVTKSATVPLAEALRLPEFMEGHIEGHLSPSEGSEADISSGDDGEADQLSSPEKEQFERPLGTAAGFLTHHTAGPTGIETGPATDLSLPVSKDPEVELPVSQFPEPQLLESEILNVEEAEPELPEAEDEDQFSPDVATDEISGMSDPSDDQDYYVPFEAPPEMLQPDEDMLEEAQIAEQDFAQPDGQPQLDQLETGFEGEHPHGLDGTTLSRVTHPASPQRDVSATIADEVKEDLSQDEDAAFAAMDEALHTAVGHSIEESQAPMAPLSSMIMPERAPSVGPVIDTPVPLQVKDQLEEAQDDVKRDSAQDYFQNTKQEGQDQETRKEEHKPTEDVAEDQPRPTPRRSLKELKQQAIERALKAEQEAAALQPVRAKSPSVEVVDLTGVVLHYEAEPQSRAVSELLKVAPRAESVPDSMDSPVTTLAPGSSRPGSRSGINMTADDHPLFAVPESQFSVQASQELGGTQYKAVSARSTKGFRLPRVQEEASDAEEDDLDEKLLAELQDGGNDLEVSEAADRAGKHDASPDEQQPTAQALTKQDEPQTDDKAKPPDQLAPAKVCPARRRPSSRLSLNHEALSDWFPSKVPASPSRRKTTSALPTEATTHLPASTAPVPSTARPTTRKSKHRSISPPTLKRYAQSQGLATSLSYFTPLTNLDLQLPSPTAKVDLLVVATADSAEVRRAKNGPRDWFTVFGVTDPGVWEQEHDSHPDQAEHGGKEKEKGKEVQLNGDGKRAVSDDVRVEVYRPWKASLPVVEKGDVLLLRAFHVRSRERRTYLISGEESAWCVWRFGEEVKNGEDDVEVKSSWAGKDGPTEEVRGPPLDVGQEERNKAEELRGWWELVQKVKDAKGKGMRATL
ncbi:Protection of telomeres protein 1 [Elsinoe australis]|uniref:Protection of telomeres protein 1 n=1 Tax=Elsinoe australis TaxID=40998 RepID=A0A2P7YL23_9PEZI|nr:Protection of telomeres protein 1 [Elsinoe australis]